MRGEEWVAEDIIDVFDKYGDIKEVRIQKDNRGEQFAVVHFNEWYPEGMKIAVPFYEGNPVRIRALYRKYFNLILFQNPTQKRTIYNNFIPIAPGISFGNPGQLSAAEFVAQKKVNNSHSRPRANSNVSDITMEDEYEGTPAHYYRHYELEEGEII
jgi:hypothetical protein